MTLPLPDTPIVTPLAFLAGFLAGRVTYPHRKGLKPLEAGQLVLAGVAVGVTLAAAAWKWVFN